MGTSEIVFRFDAPFLLLCGSDGKESVGGGRQKKGELEGGEEDGVWSASTGVGRQCLGRR